MNPLTLQAEGHKNIFGIGACTNIAKYGTVQTILGILKQADIVHHNVGAVLKGNPADGVYDGWSCTPLPLAFHAALVPEFK